MINDVATKISIHISPPIFSRFLSSKVFDVQEINAFMSNVDMAAQNERILIKLGISMCKNFGACGLMISDASTKSTKNPIHISSPTI
jgi:hypothetical protein